MASVTSTTPIAVWSEKHWEKGLVPWHSDSPHPSLVEFFSKVTNGQQNLKVFVPLCGKTVDMKWLADAGHSVVGIEGAEIGIEDFMREQQLQFGVEETLVAGRPAKIYTAKEQPIKIYCCDILAFSREQEGFFDFIWDRASFEAMAICDRESYAHVMIDVLKRDGGVYLLNVFDYDPQINPGAQRTPYPVCDDTPKKYFGDYGSVVKLSSKPILPGQHRPPWMPEEAALANKVFKIIFHQ